MSVDVRVRLRARRDIEEASRWYETQQTGLGNDFLDEVQHAFSRIAENPLAYPVVHRETHRALVQRFPFGIFYQISGGIAVVVAVMHSSRHPKRWMSRT